MDPEHANDVTVKDREYVIFAALFEQEGFLSVSQLFVQKEDMNILMTFKLPFEGVVCDYLLDLRYCPNHYGNVETKLSLDGIVYLCGQFAVIGFCRFKYQVPAVNVTFYILKTESCKGPPQRLHLDHVIAADVDAAEQGDVSHISLGALHIDDEPIPNIRSDGAVVSFLDAVGRNHFNIGCDIVGGAIVKHLLGFLDAADA